VNESSAQLAGHSLHQERQQRWRTETCRLYSRYAVEVVEALRLCPWAERARREGQVDVRVLLDTEPTPELLAAEARRCAEQAHVAIGLTLLPRACLSRRAFERLGARVRELDTAGMALACFHPEPPSTAIDASDPSSLVPWLRRTPDPTLQWVRLSMLETLRRPRAHGGGGHGTSLIDPDTIGALDLSAPTPLPLHEEVAANNLRAQQQDDFSRLLSRVEAIIEDRRRTHAALDLDPSAVLGHPGV